MSKKPIDHDQGGQILKDKSSEFTVEKFVRKRYLRGRPQYLAKWEGYPMKQCTWEPLENLGNCMTLVADFEAELYKQDQEKMNTH
ncbi:heterochromatin protein 1 [Drosophila erecta]|uniref:Oxpecker n=1 Tax=Drosophila erecta TaxID=7220 RepID=B3NMK7_DROER|nr:heterochromatin protein 1 [Drosophila erecta]EDV54946.1 oxpecker [Drosophila erecta]